LGLRALRPGYRPVRGVVGDLVVAGHAGVALLEPADGLLDLGLGLEPPGRDARLQLLQIRQEAAFVCVADRPIFGRAAITSAQDVDFGADWLAFDPDAGLLLGRIAQ